MAPIMIIHADDVGTMAMVVLALSVVVFSLKM